jgi:hypothetical protein
MPGDKRCSTCRHWYIPKDAGFLDITNNPGRKYCNSPKLVFFKASTDDGACIVDGEQYMGLLITGKDFGCINHEAASGVDISLQCHVCGAHNNYTISGSNNARG